MEQSSSCLQAESIGGGLALLSCKEEIGMATAVEFGNRDNSVPGAQGRAKVTTHEVTVQDQ